MDATAQYLFRLRSSKNKEGECALDKNVQGANRLPIFSADGFF